MSDYVQYASKLSAFLKNTKAYKRLSDPHDKLRYRNKILSQASFGVGVLTVSSSVLSG